VEEWRARYPKAKELNKEQLSTILSTPGIKAATHKSALTSPQAVHHLFTVLDTDGSGTISLYELISGLTILSTGTIEEKAARKILAKIFDQLETKMLTSAIFVI
jgi:Ca2+-binding EF-hand superfamily protein